MGLEVKKGEYAKLRGWKSPSYVTKLIDQGVVVLTKDGKRVDVEASNANLERQQSVDREGLREHHRRNRLAGEIDPHTPAGNSAPRDEGAAAAGRGSGGKGGDNFDLFNKARADKEAELAQLARMDRLEREGDLVNIATVSLAASNLGRAIERALMGLSPQFSEELAAETDPAAVARILDREMKRIRVDLADALDKLASMFEAKYRNA